MATRVESVEICVGLGKNRTFDGFRLVCVECGSLRVVSGNQI